MQDFDFCPNLAWFLPKFCLNFFCKFRLNPTKFAQI